MKYSQTILKIVFLGWYFVGSSKNENEGVPSCGKNVTGVTKKRKILSSAFALVSSNDTMVSSNDTRVLSSAIPLKSLNEIQNLEPTKRKKKEIESEGIDKKISISRRYFDEKEEWKPWWWYKKSVNVKRKWTSKKDGRDKVRI